MKDKMQSEMPLYEKLNILSDAAKYDVSCTSSGVDRQNDGTGIGNCGYLPQLLSGWQMYFPAQNIVYK